MLRYCRDCLLDEPFDSRIQGDKNATVLLPCYGLRSAFDIGKSVNVDNRRFDAKRPGGIFKPTAGDSSGRIIRIIDHRDVCKVRCNLFERL